MHACVGRGGGGFTLGMWWVQGALVSPPDLTWINLFECLHLLQPSPPRSFASISQLNTRARAPRTPDLTKQRFPVFLGGVFTRSRFVSFGFFLCVIAAQLFLSKPFALLFFSKFLLPTPRGYRCVLPRGMESPKYLDFFFFLRCFPFCLSDVHPAFDPYA